MKGLAKRGKVRLGWMCRTDFDEVADDGRVVDGVDEAGGDGGEARPAVDASEGVVEERARCVLVVVGEELGLVGGHVDADGALALAGFAGEAEVERFPDLLVLPVVGEDLALHQLPEQMGAAAGGVQLFAGGHEAGTHGSGVLSCGRLRRRRSAGWRRRRSRRLRRRRSGFWAARACSRRRGGGLRAAGAGR